VTGSTPRIDEFWRCPRSRSGLVVDGNSIVCVDPDCRLRFEIQDGIPVMLPDDAVELSIADWQSVMSRHATPSAPPNPSE